MTYKRRGVFRLAWLAVVIAAAPAPAGAQDNRDLGKTGQQIFASDCAICHKSPQGLAKAGGLFGLQNFLREHYTASRESAGLVARYLEGVGEAPAANQKRQPQRRTAKPSEGKPLEGKPVEAKPSDAKPIESRSESKPESKPEPKVEPKPEPAAAAEPKADSKPDAEIKSGIAVTPASGDKPKSE